MDDYERTLRHIHLLGAVPPDMLESLERSCEWQHLSADQIVVDRNDDTSDVYFIVKGRVQILDFVRGGREIVLAEMTAGDTFGEMSAVDKKKRSASVLTTETTVVARLNDEKFRQILTTVPDMAMTLLERFVGMVRTLTTKVTALSSLSPHQRVYMELMRLSEPNPKGDGSWIINRLPGHGEIAEQVGADREAVAAAIGELARAKIVERKFKTLVIKDYSRLQMLSNM